MTDADRELLEAAARAAWIEVCPSELRDMLIDADGSEWNPLRDDGDAFRLLVALGMRDGLGTSLHLADRDDLTVAIHQALTHLTRYGGAKIMDDHPDAFGYRAMLKNAASQKPTEPPEDEDTPQAAEENAARVILAVVLNSLPDEDPDEFLTFYQPERWLGIHRAVGGFLAAKVARLAAERDKKSDALQRLWTERDELRAERDALRDDRDRLAGALKDIIKRWDTPLWKNAGPTGEVINAGRAALGTKA